MLKINEGFLSDYTLSLLHSFRPEKQKEPAIEFAKRFIGAGLTKNDEVFISLFGKLSEDNVMSFSEFEKDVGY